MSAPANEDATGALWACLDRFLASGDPAELCSAQTRTTADAVLAALDWQALEDPGQEPTGWDAVALVAMVYWRRSRLLPEEQRVAELRLGADVLAAAHSISPGGMSAELRQQFQRVYPAETGITRVWNALGLRVLEYSEPTGSTAGASHAAELFQRAIDTAPADDPHLATYVSNLGAAHSCRFDLTGDGEALDAALDAYRQAAGLAAPGPDEHAAFLANTGVALTLRFERHGRIADLADAIDAQRRALLATPADHPDRPMYLDNLGGSLTTRFERTGDLAALEEAIGVLRSAAAARVDPDERAEDLTNLGRALLRYFEQTSDTDALSSAFDALTETVRVTSADHPGRPARLSNLAGAWLRMYDRLGDVETLDIAAEAVTEALRYPHRQRADHLSNLGAVQQRIYDHTGEPASISAAIAAYQEALAGTPHGDPARATYLSNLGGALLKRHAALSNPGDLDSSIARLAEAVRAAPADDPELCTFLSNQGDALSARFALWHEAADLDAAVAAYQAAVDVTSAPALARARAALSCGRLAASADIRHDAALSAYADAIGLVSLVAWPGLPRADQERLIKEFSGMASEAASCAIAQGQPAHAVELLEQGRGVLLGQAMDSRTSDRALTDQHPDLAERLMSLNRLLDRPAAADAGDEPADRAIRFGALARQRTELIAQIRALPGFEKFLRPPDITALQAVAAGRPVVIVNVSRYRCDALALSATGVTVIPLPTVTPDRVARAARAHLKLVKAARGFASLSAQRRESVNRALREVLAWLWDSVAAPVLDALGLQHRDSGWPRLWWCPTGLLGLLPLHAAQRYDPARLADTGVLDRVVFTYTPTVRALIGKRSPIPTGPRGARVLTVSMPRTPGLPPLPAADHEIDALGGQLIRRATVLRADDATITAVRAALRTHRWVHYVGHSSQYLQNPSQASLFLHDGRLTVLAIAQLRLSEAEFAFLSSCESGLGGTELPDEVINLATALQIAGYQHVISTLWSIGDHSGVDIAREVYAELCRPDAIAPASQATALHAALHRSRPRHPPVSWAAYCHAGS